MFTPPTSISKTRDACDRCHSKKLRCEGNGQSCTRCAQAGSACIFSPRQAYNSSNRRRRGADAPRTARRCSTSISTRSTSQEPPNWTTTNLVTLLTPTSDTVILPLPRDEGIDFWKHDDSGTATTSVFSDSAQEVNHILPTDAFGSGATIFPRARSTIVEATLSSVVHDIFHNLGTLRLEFRALDGSIQYPEVYARIFQVSQAFVQILKDVETQDAPFLDPKDRTCAEVEDADIVCTMSCFLKLLTGYDRIFTFWLDLMTSSLEDATVKATFRHTITHLLPTVSIGSFVAPPCYLSQLCLVLDVAGRMYDEFQDGLRRFAKTLNERDRAISMERISYVSDTTTELVIGRERSVALKKQKVLECSRDEGLKRRFDTTLVSS